VAHRDPASISAQDLDDTRDRVELRDRFYGLLQELRVVLPGVQVLSAFLLTVPFAQRFAQLDSFGKALFGVALFAAVLSVVSFLTPIALHRFGNRQARGRRLQVSIVMIRFGMVLLGVSLISALTVVSRFLFASAVTVVGVSVVAIAIVGLWIVLPAMLNADPPEPDVDG